MRIGDYRSALALLSAVLVLGSAVAQGSGFGSEKNLPYREGDDLTESMRERCRVDMWYPKGMTNFPTVVWFHGGGLTQGNKSIPTGLTNKGIAVVAAGYRLSPKDQAPAYIEDAAAAVAWTFRNIEKYGGSKKLIFVAGHSAGGYLTSMVGLDERWLKPHGIHPNEIAGLIPYSGQVLTHYTIRKERGLPEMRPVIDELAPIYHLRKDAPPILLLCGDREKELRGRYEENAYFRRMLLEAGHKRVTLYELQGFDHGGMTEAGHPLAVTFIRERVKELTSP